MICSRCGRENAANAQFCNGCGAPLYQQPPQPQYQNPQQPFYANPIYPYPISPMRRWVAFILCFLVGVLGIHRFYVNKIGTGVLYLLTGGLFGIGWLVDLIMIACGSFTDDQGLPLKE